MTDCPHYFLGWYGDQFVNNITTNQYFFNDGVNTNVTVPFIFQVDIEINGQPIDLHMKLGDSGEAFFVTKLLTEENVEVCEIIYNLMILKKLS